MDFFEIVNHFFNRERVDVIQLERSERGNRLLPFSSCDEPNIVRSRILRSTGSRSRSPLRRTIYRSGELTFSLSHPFCSYLK